MTRWDDKHWTERMLGVRWYGLHWGTLILVVVIVAVVALWVGYNLGVGGFS